MSPPLAVPHEELESTSNAERFVCTQVTIEPQSREENHSAVSLLKSSENSRPMRVQKTAKSRLVAY